MAQTEIYTCDICKQSKSKDDLARLDIQSSGIKIKYNYSRVRIDVCQECLKKKGFIVDAKTEEEIKIAETKNQTTLEDKIYDFLSEMGVLFQE